MHDEWNSLSVCLSRGLSLYLSVDLSALVAAVEEAVRSADAAVCWSRKGGEATGRRAIPTQHVVCVWKNNGYTSEERTKKKLGLKQAEALKRAGADLPVQVPTVDALRTPHVVLRK